MSAPRHLWSGDWRQESSAHAEALAARRAQPEVPAQVEPVAAPRRPSVSRRASRALLERLRSLRLGERGRLRAAGVVISLTLLSAGGAYVVTSLVVRVMGGA